DTAPGRRRGGKQRDRAEASREERARGEERQSTRPVPPRPAFAPGREEDRECHKRRVEHELGRCREENQGGRGGDGSRRASSRCPHEVEDECGEPWKDREGR